MLETKDKNFYGAVFKLSSSFLAHQEHFEKFIKVWGPERPPDPTKFFNINFKKDLKFNF